MNRTVWIGVLGAILLIAALLLALSRGDSGPPSPGQTGQQEAAPAEAADNAGEDRAQPAEPDADEATADGAEAGAPSPQQGEQAATAPPDEQRAPSEDAIPAPVPPSFDVVRIDRNGDTVIAGRAEPGAEVTILDNGEPLGSVAADGRGEWVYLPEQALAPGPHELTLNSILEDGTELPGKGSVVVVVPRPGQDVAGRETDDPEAQNPMVVLIPDSSEPGAEVIQAPPADAADRPLASPSDTAEPGGVASDDGQLSIETVDYDADGNLSIAGTGPDEADILAYLNNDLIGSAPVVADGNWRITPERTVDPGVYTLRLDALSGESVIARLEIPFSRAAPLQDLRGDAFVIVQPGNSLWRIARRTLGSGYSYTVIYQANADQIGDPDLIYPGQVFEIPTR